MITNIDEVIKLYKSYDKPPRLSVFKEHKYSESPYIRFCENRVRGEWLTKRILISKELQSILNPLRTGPANVNTNILILRDRTNKLNKI